MTRHCMSLLLLTLVCHTAGFAEILVPASTAYTSPDPVALRVSPELGMVNWRDHKTQIQWTGQFKNLGTVSAKVVMRLPAGAASEYRLSVGDQSKTATCEGKGDEDVSVAFGEFEIPAAGYQTFVLQSLDRLDRVSCNVRALVLEGAATTDAHFNLDPRRNAASVHLRYPVTDNADVSAFYCEMTGVEDPIWTYYMACGWHRGYLGMQVNSPTERRIIFSVWDSGNEAIDRKRVDQQDRVTLVAKGDDVYSGDFGNEGTGGHSHLKFQWKTGEKQRFLVTVEPVDATFTIFSGYYFRNDLNDWMLISSWKAPKEGRYLRGLYSFSENFVGSNGHLVRKALFDNQWIRTADGEWRELTTSIFSHDVTGKRDRRDRFMGVENNQFFLSHGGFVEGFTESGKSFDRLPTGRNPREMKLPPMPKPLQPKPTVKK